MAWQKNDNKIARALLSAFESDWTSCAGVRLRVVSCGSTITSAGDNDADQQFFDIGVSPEATAEPWADTSTSKLFDTTLGLSSLKTFDVKEFPNGTVALKPHDSTNRSRNQKSIEATEHGLAQLSRAPPGDARWSD